MHENTPAVRLMFAVTAGITARGAFSGQLTYLSQKGFDITVLASPGPELDSVAAREPVRVIGVTMRRDIAPLRDVLALLRLLQVIRRERPLILNYGTPKAGLLVGVAAWLLRVPHRLYTLHGLRLETARGWKRGVLWAAEWIACHTAHRVVCVSPSLERRAIMLGVVTAGRTAVIGSGSCNGVDFERFRKRPESFRQRLEIRHRLGIPAAARVIGFVGRFTRDKGIEELAEAFSSLSGRFQDLYLLMLGDFEAGDPVRDSVKCLLSTHSRVVNAGIVADPVPYYHAMDLLVQPTYREGFPTVSLEAAAAGKPVVTTRATGALDSVLDEYTGLLVPAGDGRALEAALVRLVESGQLRAVLGRNAARFVRRHFRSEIVWRDIAAFYQSLCPAEQPVLRFERTGGAATVQP